MKKILFLLLLIPAISSAQSIGVNYNNAYIGNNISVDYTYSLNKFYFNGGLNFHINRDEDVKSFSMLKDAGHADDFGQHLGLQLGFGYVFYKNNFVEFSAYYSSYVARMNTQTKFYGALFPLIPDPMSDEDFAFTLERREFGPLVTFENVIGLSMKTKLSDNFYTLIRGGYGVIFFKNYDENTYINLGGKPNTGHVFISSFSLGLGYTF